jgi:sugar lactone lactonase YvrE
LPTAACRYATTPRIMSGGHVWTVDEPWLDRKCVFGEGPFYESETSSLRFVDVMQKRIYTVSLVDGEDLRAPVQLDIVATVTCDIRDVDPRKRYLVGVKYGMAVLDTSTGTFELIAPFHEPSNKRLRSNDGAADPHGRFWLGSMTDFDQGEVLAEGNGHLQIKLNCATANISFC